MYRNVALDRLPPQMVHREFTREWTQLGTYGHTYVIYLRTGSPEALWGFLVHLNKLYLSIKFTHKIGEDFIPFFDVRVTLDNGDHKFEVYRQPTATAICVSNESFGYTRNKIFGPSSMIYRLIKLPLESPAFQKELITIKYCGVLRWSQKRQACTSHKLFINGRSC